VKKILGIDTSCDDTSAAVVDEEFRVLSNVVSNQNQLHAKYEGVVPELASRRHVEMIWPVVNEALDSAEVSLAGVDAVAVCKGPGLIGSLLVGVSFAKAVSYATGKALIGINHLEAHIYSAWLDWPLNPESNGEPGMKVAPRFPLLALIVSGGHTELILVEDHLKYRRLGGTLDDAAGEAFDKIARLLGLGYPGGPAIERAATRGNSTAWQVKITLQIIRNFT